MLLLQVTTLVTSCIMVLKKVYMSGPFYGLPRSSTTGLERRLNGHSIEQPVPFTLIYWQERSLASKSWSMPIRLL